MQTSKWSAKPHLVGIHRWQRDSGPFPKIEQSNKLPRQDCTILHPRPLSMMRLWLIYSMPPPSMLWTGRLSIRNSMIFHSALLVAGASLEAWRVPLAIWTPFHMQQLKFPRRWCPAQEVGWTSHLRWQETFANPRFSHMYLRQCCRMQCQAPGPCFPCFQACQATNTRSPPPLLHQGCWDMHWGSSPLVGLLPFALSLRLAWQTASQCEPHRRAEVYHSSPKLGKPSFLPFQQRGRKPCSTSQHFPRNSWPCCRCTHLDRPLSSASTSTTLRPSSTNPDTSSLHRRSQHWELTPAGVYWEDPKLPSIGQSRRHRWLLQWALANCLRSLSSLSASR